MGDSRKKAKVKRYADQTREDVLRKLAEAKRHLEEQTQQRRKRRREAAQSLDIRY
jgi:hypothetical protein